MNEEYNELVEWLLKDHMTFISTKLTTNRTLVTGNSIFTCSKIFKNEKIISIPPSLNLNFLTVLQHLQIYRDEEFSVLVHTKQEAKSKPHDIYTEIYSKISYNELVDLTSFQLISFYLAFEYQRIERSFWKPFLQVLPTLQDFANIPFTWIVYGDMEHFDKLPQSVKSHSNRQFKLFSNDYNKICKLLGSKDPSYIEHLPRDLFLRFWLCCNSRCLYMKLPEELQKENEDNFTMVPYVDFLNHDLNESCFVKVCHSTSFQVYSGVNYNPGDQIYLSYGAHSNEFLLCEYGFMFDRGVNKWNSVDVTEQIMTLLSPKRVDFLKQIGYLGDYHINVDISYRIEIALLVLQEDESSLVEGKVPRRLTNFIGGVTGGENYKTKSLQILQEMLLQISKMCQPYLEMSIQNYKDQLIQKLYQDINDIAIVHMQNLL